MKILLVLVVTGLTAHAQNYSIPWSKIASGGGTSTGAFFAVQGTIGQHDADGPLTNSAYAVTGGFWVLPAVVQTAGAPTLSIAPGTPGRAIISWTPATPGYLLQESTSFNPTEWRNAPSGASNPVTVPADPDARFYRLHKP